MKYVRRKNIRVKEITAFFSFCEIVANGEKKYCVRKKLDYNNKIKS